MIEEIQRQADEQAYEMFKKCSRLKDIMKVLGFPSVVAVRAAIDRHMKNYVIPMCDFRLDQFRALQLDRLGDLRLMTLLSLQKDSKNRPIVDLKTAGFLLSILDRETKLMGLEGITSSVETEEKFPLEELTEIQNKELQSLEQLSDDELNNLYLKTLTQTQK